MYRSFAILLCVALLSIAAYTQTATRTGTLTKEERKLAVDQLKRTQDEFLKAIEGLSEAQWNYKPAPDKWSVAEVAEHIGVSETTIFGLIGNVVMKSPATPEKMAEVKGKDMQVIQMVPDRTSKFQAPEMLKPTGRWATREALVKEFKTNRATTIKYAAETNDPLRSHFLDHPALKLLDGYQWLLLLSAHSERHTKQILEVKADAGFPKK